MSELVTISASDGTDSAEQGYDLTVLPALSGAVVIRASDGEQSTNQAFAITVLPPVTEPEPHPTTLGVTIEDIYTLRVTIEDIYTLAAIIED